LVQAKTQGVSLNALLRKAVLQIIAVGSGVNSQHLSGVQWETNVLLRALDRNHPIRRIVRRNLVALRRQDDNLFLAAQNLIEFWAVATRPVDSNGLGMSVRWAAAQLLR
jgi:hypothetical protein